MTDFIWSTPTARTRHRCHLCYRVILPGERYNRMAGLDRGAAWTYKLCDHCAYITDAYPEHEWDDECVREWVEDEHPTWWQQMLAGWRYPDGELLPPPYQPRCVECGAHVQRRYPWCPPCDEARLHRLSSQMVAIRNDLMERAS